MFQSLIKSFIRIGRLTVVMPDGDRFEAGEFCEEAPALNVVLRLKRWPAVFKLGFNPEFYLGESYMNGDLVIEHGDIEDLLELIGRNLPAFRSLQRSRPLTRIAQTVARHLQRGGSRRRSPLQVAHHYDLSGELFSFFLDADMQYSCAYFKRPSLTLDEAQLAKKQHIAAKLLLKPGVRILDIGSGWGGLALSLADLAPGTVKGITLSREQHAIATRRAIAANAADRVSFELQDYRELSGSFDRIVSVGMFEHVGAPYYDTFFKKIAELLTEDGVALIHSIGRMETPGPTNTWMRKYIFPGGYLPALSEVTAAAERAGLVITDIEILRLHYAMTLRHWRLKFVSIWPQISSLYDERFFRMWEFYLAACEMAFRYDNQSVFQLQLARNVNSVPLTRDYMFTQEQLYGGVNGDDDGSIEEEARLSGCVH